MKISIIGAGSVRFAQQLIGDIAHTEELSRENTHVYLMDINEKRLTPPTFLQRNTLRSLIHP